MDSYILGIETSCDETSAAVVRNGTEVLSNVISSQIDIHKLYGGVVPEVASRNHLENIMPVIKQALKEAGLKKEELTAIGVTNEPGLIGALLVGITAAKGLSMSLGIPLIPVHHLRGHIYANLLEHSLGDFPILALIVSGGHTTLALWHSHKEIEVIGETRDDAAGEAFDKIARKLGLGYPGGPEIEKLALLGKKEALTFPVAKLGVDSFDFSYSGLKSSVINYLSNSQNRGDKINVPDVCLGVQEAIIDSLVDRVLRGQKAFNVRQLVLGGGVTSNKALVSRLEKEGFAVGLEVFHPSPILCTDNGVMIAAAAYYLAQEGIQGDLYLNAHSNARIK